MFGGFYNEKRVLVTGHTGFKGCWLSLWLRKLGAEVHGLALQAPRPSLYVVVRSSALALHNEVICDVRDAVQIESTLQSIKPEVVFHLAAQAIVRRSYAEPRDTFEINAM